MTIRPWQAATALNCLGLWISARYAFTTWYAESDAAYADVLWYGVQQHGPGFLLSFNYAQDNWLLWPLPLLFLAFSVFGPAPWVTFTVGWAILVACAAVAALILRRIAGITPALLAAAVLLLSPRSTVGEAGFLSYPVTHNASMLLGLLGLLAATAWVLHGRVRSLLACGILLLIAGLSDPWTEAAFTLPLGCTALFLVTRMADRRSGLVLGLVLTCVLLVDHTRLFGALAFLHPAMPPYGWREAWPAGLHWLTQYAALLFQFVPHWNATYGRLPMGLELDADLSLLAAGLIATAALSRRARRTTAFDMLAVTAVSSTLITAAAYVLLDIPNALSLARLFMAVHVFAILLFAAAAAAAWTSLSPRWRAAVALYALLLPAAGIASAPAAWTRAGLHTAFPGISPFDRGVDGFAAFLLAHGLTYGYGSYWGNEANAVAWLTKRAVVMHPVSFDIAAGRIQPFYTLTSRLWYTSQDEPARPPRTFLAITPGFDGCPAPDACERAAISSFGPAAERLTYGETVVLVWEHRLFNSTDIPATAANG